MGETVMRAAKLIAIATIVNLGLVATPAYAGSPVYGYGATQAGAASDANNNARAASQNRFGRGDCYTPVRPQDCRRNADGYVCIAYVANHRGSCGF